MNKTSSLSLADMMSALMMTFMFIALAFLAELEVSRKTFTQELNEALHREFGQDLPRWQATITPENIVRFKAPFTVGSAEIPERFTATLGEFCPRYVQLLSDEQFASKIAEIRVEGHTSKGWNNTTTPQQAYINNMELSQQRATGVLAYCYLLEHSSITAQRKWIEGTFRANGLASSVPVVINDKPSDHLSRRVDFMVLPKAEQIR